MAIRKEIPLKGSIAYGTIAVYDEQNLFCGQPIIDAYQLEEDLQYMGVVFHHTFEDELFRFKDTQTERISEWIKDVPTPFKYGKRTHLNLDYRIAGIEHYDLSKKVENQRFYSSGDARKYVDNTLEMYRIFETYDHKKRIRFHCFQIKASSIQYQKIEKRFNVNQLLSLKKETYYYTRQRD